MLRAMLGVLLLTLPLAASFSPASSSPPRVQRAHSLRRRVSTVRAEADVTDAAADSTTTTSLEEKMASWEASAEEQRASTLGGNIPLIGMPGLPGFLTRTDQPTKMDGFDLGMNLSGIILFPLALVILFFPFFMGSIDVSSVGPPPTS